MPEEPVQGARRYLKTREKVWAHTLARVVKQLGLTPNMISVLSIFFAAQAALSFYLLGSSAPTPGMATLLWLAAIAGIQLRLLCNLLDGMVAIEGGMKSPVGSLYNEIPDRIADPLILAAAGYAAPAHLTLWGLPLGWVAAVLSLMTAYIRVLGGTVTGNQSFIGPMAKQHRMAVLSLGCLGSIVEAWSLPSESGVYRVLWVTLIVIILGSVITSWRRTGLISRELHKHAGPPA